MLDFIWHLRGSTALAGSCTNDAALNAVTALLKKQRKPIVEFGVNSIAFNDPLWSNPFSMNHSSMVIYDRGRFWIEQTLNGPRLRYELRSLHGMVFCLFGALTALLFGLASGGFIWGLEVAAIAFAWLYGMNVLLALARVPSAIRRAVRST